MDKIVEIKPTSNPTTPERSRDAQEMKEAVKNAPVKIQVGVRGTKVSPDWIAIDAFDRDPLIDYNWDLHCLPIADDSVDAFICNAVLEHVPHPELAVYEMFRTLRPGGRIWVEVPFIYQYHPSPHDFYRWTVPGLKVLLRDYEIISAGVGVKAAYLAYNLINNIAKTLKRNLSEESVSSVFSLMNEYDSATKDPVEYGLSYVSARKSAADLPAERKRYMAWWRGQYIETSGRTFPYDPHQLRSAGELIGRVQAARSNRQVEAAPAAGSKPAVESPALRTPLSKTGPQILRLEELVTRTQLDPNRELWDDRAIELAGFLGITKDEAIRLYQDLNVHPTRRLPPNLFADQDHASIVRSYLDDTFLKTSLTRLMLHYNRFGLAWRVLAALSEARESDDYQGCVMVDYGCGAADYALAFSVLGAIPVVVDLAGGPLGFASYRFDVRSIAREAIAVTTEIEYPPLPRADVINAAEVLEHVNDPPHLIEQFHAALRPAGYFTFSDYPVRPKEVGGAHLKAAAEKREAALDLLNKLFASVWADPKVGYVYRARS